MTQTTNFHPLDHLIQIRNRDKTVDYLPVQYRLVWFRQECPEGSINTEMVMLDLDRETEETAYAWNNETRRSEKVIKKANGFCIFRASITNGKGGSATATKSEKAASFADYIEKCESGAIGRALAMLGYGTQFTGDELAEQHRIVDAPVDSPVEHDSPSTSGNADDVDSSPATPAQLNTIKMLAVKLGKQLQRPKSFAEAQAIQEMLQVQYDAMIARGRAS